MSVAPDDAIELVFREESGRAIATLIRLFGSIDVAEEAVQDAFLIAIQRWPADGLPLNPGGWITTTARNRAIDRLRRESSRDERHVQAMQLDPRDNDESASAVDDDRLRLIFTCCHPALAPEARVALTLRLLGGLRTPEIAGAFLVPEATMSKRLVRAKRKIAAARIPYRVPVDHDLPERLRPVLAVLYLIFNAGYVASEGDALVRTDLCEEAIRLARVLVVLMPDEAEALGLLALLLLIDARGPARTDADGAIVLLADQDRSLWDAEKIAEGQALVRRCLRRNHPGPFQIQAAINAVHSDTPTDWHQVLALYDQLLIFSPTPVVALNRAIALAEVDGPEVGLEAVDALVLPAYQPFHATRADLLRRLGRVDEARVAYDAAIELTDNGSERRFLEQRSGSLRAN